MKLYSSDNEEKSSVVERWNRTMKQKIWREFTASNNTVYTDTLLELVDQYNNTKHSSVKMTPVEASKRSNKRIVYFNAFGYLKREF